MTLNIICKWKHYYIVGWYFVVLKKDLAAMNEKITCNSFLNQMRNWAGVDDKQFGVTFVH